MEKIEFTTAEREALKYWRFHHPHPRVQRTLEGLYLQSQGLAPAAISRLCAISQPTFYRYLHEYRAGGREKLTEVSFYRRQSQLAPYRTTIEADLWQHPPATVAEAAARIAALTGLQRGPTQVRQFFKSLRMQPRKVGQIPAKADVTTCELLRLLAGAHPGMPITVVLDNARYQRCALVQGLAQRLTIELLFLPAYSPNLHLIERFWKFVKKQCLYSKYYEDHPAFQRAILKCIAQAPDKHKEALASLLTLKFQSFKTVQVIGKESNVSLFPVTRRTQRKVSSKAA